MTCRTIVCLVDKSQIDPPLQVIKPPPSERTRPLENSPFQVGFVTAVGEPDIEGAIEARGKTTMVGSVFPLVAPRDLAVAMVQNVGRILDVVVNVAEGSPCRCQHTWR